MQTSQYSLYGNELGGFHYVRPGLGQPLFTDNTIGHGRAIPQYLTKIAFKTRTNGIYGIVLSLNKSSSLEEDQYLINTFYPAIINLIFDEAARLFTF